MRYKYLIHRLQKISHRDFLMHGNHRRLQSGVVMPKKPKVVFRNSPELFKNRVYATPVIAVALLYAIVHADHSAWDWCFMRKDGELRLYCRLKKERLLIRKGYLHILPKGGFQNRGTGVTFQSRHRVRPVETIRVSARIIKWLMEEAECCFVWEFPESDELISNRPFRRVSRVR